LQLSIKITHIATEVIDELSQTSKLERHTSEMSSHLAHVSIVQLIHAYIHVFDLTCQWLYYVLFCVWIHYSQWNFIVSQGAALRSQNLTSITIT